MSENSPSSLDLGDVALIEKGNTPPLAPGRGETLVLVDAAGLFSSRMVAIEVEAEGPDPDADPRDSERIVITDASLSRGNVAFVGGDQVVGGISAARDGI